MLIPRFEAASLTEDRIASLEGDDATSARAGASGVLQDVETALVLGPVVLSTSAADASKLLDVLNIDAIFSSIVQIQDEIVTTGTDLLREAVISLLDRGVAGVVLSVDSTSLSEFKTIFNGIPLDRVGAALRLQDINAPDAVELMKSLNPLVGTYIVTVQGEVSLLEASSETEPTPKAAFVRDLAVSAVKQMSALAQSGRQRRMMLCLPQHKLSAPLVAKLEKMEVGLVGESKDIEFTHAKVSGNQTTPRGIILADSFVACLVTDRSDGLFATVVVDEQGVALGLAYSSQESIREAVRTRQGVYHSRSRGLWYKGLTSGATQMLYRIDVDCDKDALRFTVHQNEPGMLLQRSIRIPS